MQGSEKLDDSERDLAMEQHLLSQEQRQRVERESNMDFDKVMADPKKYGMPTFAEFAKNPAQWKLAKDHLFSAISNGSKTMSQFIEDQEYEFMGYKSKSLEEMERIVKNEGYELHDLEMKPRFVDVGNVKGKLLVELKVKKRKSNLVGPDGGAI